MLYDDGWVRIKSAYSALAVSVVADMKIRHRIQSVRLQSLAPADVLFALEMKVSHPTSRPYVPFYVPNVRYKIQNTPSLANVLFSSGRRGKSPNLSTQGSIYQIQNTKYR